MSDETKKKRVNCPVCGESDMKWTQEEADEDGGGYIECVNLNCASNGGTNADALIQNHNEGDRKSTKDHPGMSLRDYFAGQRAATLTVARPSSFWQWLRRGLGMEYRSMNMSPECAAEICYQFADEMLKAREK